MPRLRYVERGLDLDTDHDIDADDRFAARSAGRRRARSPERGAWSRPDHGASDPPRVPAPAKRRSADGRESFKCRHCRAFIGPTVSGGRHRNHCPLCLYSRHVDAKTPGDRASDCRSLMAPVGTFHRPKGEQVVLHRCLGCGLERHNRIAADDNPAALLRLPPVAPRIGRVGVEPAVEQEEATA